MRSVEDLAGTETDESPAASPAVTINRVTSIGRPTISVNAGTETVQFVHPLGGVVARLAEALERTEPEPITIAVMRLDVVADLRWRDDAALEAELAQRLLEQLVPADPSPTRGTVPG